MATSRGGVGFDLDSSPIHSGTKGKGGGRLPPRARAGNLEIQIYFGVNGAIYEDVRRSLSVLESL